MSRIVTLFLLIYTTRGFSQFHTPIEGKYGKEYIIVNYVDWEVQQLLKIISVGVKPTMDTKEPIL
mgnify:CR=1 FL=1